MRSWVPWVLLAAGCGGDDGRDSGDARAESDGSETAEPEVVDAADTSDTSPPVAPWYEHAVMYEIFVRSFQDSDGDGIGDLAGLTGRLDYLNDGVPGAGDDLEVDGLWLMPIFQSPSYHGYDTVDYDTIEEDYGTNADFAALVAAADARGLKIVLDLVMNHTSDRHPWFAAAKSASDPKRGWYVWRDDNPGWKQPFGNGQVWHASGDAFYYGIFTGSMPDLNYRSSEVVAAMTGVARTWLDRGAAGFRLDAARYLVESEDGGLFEQPETHAFWKSFREELEVDHELYLVGEVWTGRAAVATYYGDGDELHQAFDFDLSNAIRRAVENGDAAGLRAELGVAAAGVPANYRATFLTNHDLDRLSNRLSDGAQQAAATVLMTLPGTPYIYYGDELGMKSSPAAGDQAKRGPMAWTADAGLGFTSGTPWLAAGAESATRNVASALADPQSLLHHYQALVRLRRAHPALADDGVSVVANPDARLFVILRGAAEQAVYLVVVNMADAAIDATSVDLSAWGAVLGDGPWNMECFFGQDAPRQVTDARSVPIGPAWTPYESRVWRLERK